MHVDPVAFKQLRTEATLRQPAWCIISELDYLPCMHNDCYIAVCAFMKFQFNWLLCIREHHNKRTETIAKLMHGSEWRSGMSAIRRAHISLKMLNFSWRRVSTTNLHFAKRALQPLSDNDLVILWHVGFCL